jgi:predicted O-methyltransferase YrrM
MNKLEHFYQNIGEDWFPYTRLYAFMVQKFESGSKFVEVGSWKGRSASFMAVEINNSEKNIKLDCIDTWKGSDDEEYHQNDTLVKTDTLYESFLKNIEPVKHVINPIRMTSVEGSKLYQDNSLDFVFIDACHTYECVKEDIEHWLPKVKIGGILAGHDFHYPTVSKAVLEKFPDVKYDRAGDCWLHEKLV